MNEKDEEHDSDEDIKIDFVKLKVVRWDNLQILILIGLIVFALFVGGQLGYRQGYTYVKDWYVEYLGRCTICICPDPDSNTQEFSYPGELFIMNQEKDNTTLTNYID